MGKIILACTLSIFAIVAFSQEQPQLLVDFGTLTPEERPQQELALDFEVTNVVIPCSCVTAKMKPVEASELPILAVGFNPTGYQGEVIQDITLVDSDENLITVRVKAFVE